MHQLHIIVEHIIDHPFVYAIVTVGDQPVSARIPTELIRKQRHFFLADALLFTQGF